MEKTYLYVLMENGQTCIHDAYYSIQALVEEGIAEVLVTGTFMDVVHYIGGV